MSKKIKHILLEDSVDLSYILIGIAGGLKDYRLCALLDEQFGWSFSVGLILNKQHGKETLPFELFGTNLNNDHTSIIACANRKEGIVLISELNQFDLLIKIVGECPMLMEEKLIHYLKQLQEVQIVNKIDLSKLKQPEWLDFEIPNKNYLEQKKYVERTKQYAAKDL
jgi:hypothetical protein